MTSETAADRRLLRRWSLVGFHQTGAALMLASVLSWGLSAVTLAPLLRGDVALVGWEVVIVIVALPFTTMLVLVHAGVAGAVVAIGAISRGRLRWSIALAPWFATGFALPLVVVLLYDSPLRSLMLVVPIVLVLAAYWWAMRRARTRPLGQAWSRAGAAVFWASTLLVLVGFLRAVAWS